MIIALLGYIPIVLVLIVDWRDTMERKRLLKLLLGYSALLVFLYWIEPDYFTFVAGL